MNTGLVLVAFVAAWMVAGVILASAFGARLRRCADAASTARHQVVLGTDRRGAEPLRWVLPASIVVMAVASSTGLAAAGVLPARVQVVARSVLGTVGLEVPDATDRYTTDAGAPTPDQAPVTRPVPPSAAPGSATPRSAGRPVTTAPSAADRSPDPFPDGLAPAVADHLVSPARPLAPAPGAPTTPDSDVTGPTPDVPPAPVPPADVPAQAQERAGVDPAPEVPAETGAARPPKSTPGTRPHPPKHTPSTRPEAPEAPAAGDPAPVAPVAPVVEPPPQPAAAPALPPPAATAPGQAVSRGDASRAELARQEREQRRLAKEQDKANKKVQLEQVAPVLPPPAVDPVAPAQPTLAGP